MDKDNPFDKPLDVILGEVPDYAHYRTLASWKLYDAVCLLIRLPPNERDWSKQREFVPLYEKAIADILSGYLSADKVEGSYRVDALDWIKWARDSGELVPIELEGYKPGRERQKQSTAQRNHMIQSDAEIIAAQLTGLGKPTPKRIDSIIRVMREEERYKKKYIGISDSVLRKYIFPSKFKLS